MTYFHKNLNPDTQENLIVESVCTSVDVYTQKITFRYDNNANQKSIFSGFSLQLSRNLLEQVFEVIFLLKMASNSCYYCRHVNCSWFASNKKSDENVLNSLSIKVGSVKVSGLRGGVRGAVPCVPGCRADGWARRYALFAPRRGVVYLPWPPWPPCLP